MEISIRKTSESFTIELHGEADKMRRLDNLLDAIKQGMGEPIIRIELDRIDFITSGFINFLVVLRNGSPELSAKIVLASPNPFIMELLVATHVSKIYRVELDSSKTLTALNQRCVKSCAEVSKC